MACTYMSGQMEGVFVHRASSQDIGQVWIPKLCDAITCDSGMGNYQIGQWLRIDMLTKRVVQALPSGPYESTHHEIPSYVFVKVKVPLVFYSEPSENPNNKVVAYSPQFGRIGHFFEHKDRVTDKLRYALISYMHFYRGNIDLRKMVKAFHVDWMVSNLEDVLTTEQIREENKKYQKKFCTGIVVRCEEQRHVEPGVAYIAFHIWTADLEGGKPGIATHRILKEKLEEDEQMKKLRTIGTFCKLVIFKNWANKFTAVSPFPIERPTGYHVESNEPNLKLKIAHDRYHLDQNPDALQVHIRDLIGPITCSRDFIRQFRRVRQGQPGFQPRLFIEFNGDDNEWKAAHFDGSNRSPSPGPSTSQTIQQFPNRGSAFTKYRSPKALPIDSEESLNDSPPSSSDQSVPQPLNGSGGANRASPPPSICSEFGDSDDEEMATLAEAVKTGTDLDNTTTTESTSTNPTINGRPRPMPLNSLPNGSGPPPRRRGPQNRFANNSPSNQFLDGISRPQRATRVQPVKGKKNISGVLVSKTNDGFFVYTPHYHPNELFLPNTKVCPGCKHGSWIFFDTKEEGDRVEILNPRLDATMPYETIVVRNTVQLKLDGMVPKKWTPQMSTFLPVIKTNYIEDVIDSKALLNEDFAGASLPVVVERKKDKKTGFMWFIASLGEGY